ncbi:uncharacterized protein [Choristoneura fumiferana]|uniref:uncharacterized protein n=1 Tax=Choristoneura fumiferana TaxID=7141 RepID=UPI003D15B64F
MFMYKRYVDRTLLARKTIPLAWVEIALVVIFAVQVVFVVQIFGEFGAAYYLPFRVFNIKQRHEWSSYRGYFSFTHCAPFTCLDEVFTVLAATLLIRYIALPLLTYFKEFIFNTRTDFNQGKKITTKVPCWEREFRLDTITEEKMARKYNSLVLQFALVSLVGAVFPLAPLFAFFANVIHIRLISLCNIRGTHVLAVPPPPLTAGDCWNRRLEAHYKSTDSLKRAGKRVDIGTNDEDDFKAAIHDENREHAWFSFLRIRVYAGSGLRRLLFKPGNWYRCETVQEEPFCTTVMLLSWFVW